jgi:phage gp46-like protein
VTDILIRQSEACSPDPFLLWDSVWNPAAGAADWALAGADELLNRGGLAARQALETAVILALFTDRRVPRTHPLAPLADGDPRGWWGDGVDVRADLGETELGSLLWLLERASLDLAQRWAPQLALEALAPLKAQGVVVRIDCTAAADELRQRIELTVNLYGRDGARVYDQKFQLVWNQLGGQ